MTGKNTIPQLISPAEAIKLHNYSTTEEMQRAIELYNAFDKAYSSTNNEDFYIISLLSFVYSTGRVQGIREERAKKTNTIERVH